MQSLVLASNNRHKLDELGALFAPLGFGLIAQGALHIVEAEEPFDTFVENALAKARHAAAASGMAAIADDSGLCVAALGGLPGVHSATYACEGHAPRSDAANNQKLLRALEGVEPQARGAFFVSTLVALRSADDPSPLIAEGRWYGFITKTARGDKDFGYSPVFELPQIGLTAAEISAEDKNRLSHRALAAARMRELMQMHWGA